MMRRGWRQPHAGEPANGPGNIRRDRVAIGEVKIEGPANLRPILHPMGATNWYVNALSGEKLINSGAVLVFRLVNRGVLVHGPEPFDLRLRQHIAVRPVEDADRF